MEVRVFLFSRGFQVRGYSLLSVVLQTQVLPRARSPRNHHHLCQLFSQLRESEAVN